MDHTHRTQDERLEVKTTTCYMCACRCGIRVHLRDGAIRYIDGNPAHPLNQGAICAKGAAGIMKQYSPARLTQPLVRKPGAERGSAQFEPISWEAALSQLETRLAHLRATDPKRFALFTGRDQMQALTGLFAKQFGTPNYAAHGGFCSVNMAAGMIYTVGGSFWEFGGPDLARAKLFFMIGTAEDHHCFSRAAPRLPWCWACWGLQHRSSTSAIPNERGAPLRCGAPRGSLASACVCRCFLRPPALTDWRMRSGGMERGSSARRPRSLFARP